MTIYDKEACRVIGGILIAMAIILGLIMSIEKLIFGT